MLTMAARRGCSPAVLSVGWSATLVDLDKPRSCAVSAFRADVGGFIRIFGMTGDSYALNNNPGDTANGVDV